MTSDDAALEYHVVDVFSATPYAGNPLAVVLGADNVSTGQLQSLAREFNLSETAFPMAATAEGATYRLRIFTPSTELPFAGHPSVGAAWVMRRLGRIDDGDIVQECGAGLLPLSVSADAIALTGGAATFGEPLDAAPFLSAVGLDDGDVAGTPVRWAGCGLEFAFLHVRESSLSRCAPELAQLGKLGNGGVSVFAADGDRMHVRVFAGGVGVAEDPATGLSCARARCLSGRLRSLAEQRPDVVRRRAGHRDGPSVAAGMQPGGGRRHDHLGDGPRFGRADCAGAHRGAPVGAGINRIFRRRNGSVVLNHTREDT